MNIKELVNLIIRIGVGSTLLIGGMVLIICGSIYDYNWPAYVIGGSVIMVTGLIAICLDIFKTIRQQKLDLQRIERQTEQCKNFDTYKVLTEKRARQDKRLEKLKEKEWVQQSNSQTENN